MQFLVALFRVSAASYRAQDNGSAAGAGGGTGEIMANDNEQRARDFTESSWLDATLLPLERLAVIASFAELSLLGGDAIAGETHA